jgi:hypothetical protein
MNIEHETCETIDELRAENARLRAELRRVTDQVTAIRAIAGMDR